MKCKLITTASDISKTEMLQKSLKKFDWDYHIIVHPWYGFEGKIKETYNYLKANPDITHFFYTDSYDTIVTKTMEETLKKITSLDCIIMSAERGCYPHPEKEKLYPKNDSPWHFVNGGGWFCKSEVFCKLVEENPYGGCLNDQVWFTDLFLNNPDYVKLDYNCEVFQTVGFCPDTDFEIENTITTKDSWTGKSGEMSGVGTNTLSKRILNTVTKTYPAFIHGNGHTPIDRFYSILKTDMNTIKELQSEWMDTPASHKNIHDTLCEKVNAVPELKELRDYVESNIFGFGERSFYWLFKLIADTQVYDMKFLEIGVFRGQVLALMRTLKPKAKITGITPLDTTNDGVNHHWESDYAADIKQLHDHFKLEQPKIIKGLSTDSEIITEASKTKWDVIYVDGGHAFEVAKSDIYHYSSFVRVGGYLIVDDCAHKYNLPDGMFRGIDAVSQAVDSLLPNEYYKEICSVVHIRVFQRIK